MRYQNVFVLHHPFPQHPLEWNLCFQSILCNPRCTYGIKSIFLNYYKIALFPRIFKRIEIMGQTIK